MPIWRQVFLAALMVSIVGIGWQYQENLRAVLGLTASVESPRSSRGSGNTPVIVAPVELAEDRISLEVVGTGKAIRSVMLRSAVSGKITKMPLNAGDRFEAGDMLVLVDDEEQRVALELARAKLSDAIKVRERIEKLQTTGSATRASLEQAQTAERVARLEVDLARVQLEDRRLRAPFSGVAGIPSMEQGAWVDNSMEIASFDDRSQLQVEFDIPETFLSRVAVGAPVTATTPAVEGREFVGTVSAIDSRIASQSRTSRVRVKIPNEDDVLRPGSSFTIQLDLAGGMFPVVPELSLQFARGNLHVWRVVDDSAERVDVRMVRRRDGKVLVEGDLSAEDIVVVEGAQRLVPGRKLEILRTRTVDKPKTS